MNNFTADLPEKKKTLNQVIENRNITLFKYYEALENINEAWFYHAQLNEHTFHFKLNGTRIYDPSQFSREREVIRKDLDRQVWQYLAEETGLYDLMDEEAKKSFEASLKEDVLEITEENVLSTFTALSNRREEIFIRGIVNVFKGLSKKLISNDPFRIGKKIILTNCIMDSAYNSIQDVERILYILDKKGPPTYNESVVNYIRLNSIQGIPLADVENDYFLIKRYQNKRIHLIFKRPDLIEKINKIIASEMGPTHLGDRSKSKNWKSKSSLRKSA